MDSGDIRDFWDSGDAEKTRDAGRIGDTGESVDVENTSTVPASSGTRKHYNLVYVSCHDGINHTMTRFFKTYDATKLRRNKTELVRRVKCSDIKLYKPSYITV